jgi:hypothetical protein
MDVRASCNKPTTPEFTGASAGRISDCSRSIMAIFAAFSPAAHVIGQLMQPWNGVDVPPQQKCQSARVSRFARATGLICSATLEPRPCFAE